MGHDIDLVNVHTREVVGRTYITFNYSKYKDKYPGIHDIHGHRNSTVIKIIRRTLDKLLDDGIVPQVHNPATRALTFGDKDPRKDLECYAACLQEFLSAAFKIRREWAADIYWYSDQVGEVEHFKDVKDGYESDGLERDASDSDSD